MRYLITGYKGQLGFDIVRELQSRGEEDILALDYEEMDITDKESVDKVVIEANPDVIFHCAAYTQVDVAEENEDACYKVNAVGTKNMVDAAKKVGAKIVYISTDYVFDGTKEGIYEVTDTPNPLGVYGKTKYEGELEALKYERSFVVRTSWVFGINGKNFVKTMLKLSETKTELNVVADQVGSPTYTVDLAKLLVDMVNTDKYGIYHANNEGFCSWAEFAEYIFESNAVEMKVNHIETKDYPVKATRPLNSKLSKSSLTQNGFKLLPSWQNAVDRYNEELEKEKVFIRK